MILIVEDDAQVARLISLVLQRNGYTSEIVNDGSVALDHIRSNPPQLVFADLKVKGLAGDALCAALHNDPTTSGVPVVVVSGDRDIAEKARRCGAKDHLGKPFEFDDLIRLVKKHVEHENHPTD
ncbi:MAG: response regulator [Thermoanaerobaculia bacterium]